MSIDTTRRFSTQSASGARPASRSRISARVVGAYVPKLTRKAFEKYGFSAASLLTDWPSIVGAEVAGFAAPERLKWPRGVAIREEVGAEGRPGAVLVLRVDPARALDVQYKAQQILERINVYFGYRAVAELRIVQAPLAKRASVPAPQQIAKPRTLTPSEAPELADIADEQLRNALTRLKSWLTDGTQAA